MPKGTPLNHKARIDFWNAYLNKKIGTFKIIKIKFIVQKNSPVNSLKVLFTIKCKCGATKTKWIHNTFYIDNLQTCGRDCPLNKNSEGEGKTSPEEYVKLGALGQRGAMNVTVQKIYVKSKNWYRFCYNPDQLEPIVINIDVIRRYARNPRIRDKFVIHYKGRHVMLLQNCTVIPHGNAKLIAKNFKMIRKVYLNNQKALRSFDNYDARYKIEEEERPYMPVQNWYALKTLDKK